MALPRYYCFPLVLLLNFYLVSANPVSSFYLKRFDKDGTFDPEITLLGDAHVVDNGSCVRITKDSIFSGGRVMYKNPFKFVDGNRKKPLSFSTYIEFSSGGWGIDFVFLPSGFDGNSFGVEKSKDGVLVVEFDALMNHVGVDIGGSNVSSVRFVLNSGERLHCWIDYEASSKRLEVRLSGVNTTRPYDPLLSYQVSLSDMWKDEDMFVGISSSNGNSTQSASIYSWSFRLRHVPSWFHSQPLDPHYKLQNTPELPQLAEGRNVCLSRILAALMFGIGCGALAVIVVMFMRATIANRQAAVVVPADYPGHPLEFGYEKIKIVVQKATADAKKVET